MKLNTTLDVEAPAAFTFSELSDYETIERLAMQRGVSLRRTDRIEGPAAGMSWVADWEIAGRSRRTNLSITRFEPPRLIVVETETSGIAGRMEMEVVPLTPAACRLLIGTELTPVTFGARVLMQPIKLARKTIDRRVEERKHLLSERIGERYRASLRA